jgi:hypothetical protein
MLDAVRASRQNSDAIHRPSGRPDADVLPPVLA